MAHHVERPVDVDAFLARSGAFLAGREAEHILPLGICSSLRASPSLFTEAPRFAIATDATGSVAAASLRTPPWNQVLSTADDLGAIDALADVLADEELRGVTGPKREAARFAERWARASGRTASVEIAERTFVVEGRTTPPPMPPRGGHWRPVLSADRDTIARWLVAFQDEAVPGSPPIADPLAAADRWVAGIGRIGYAWEDEGEMVALLGIGGETPSGIRIGPVYTPPERRRNGYASSLTAAAAQDQLDRGRRFVFLFTDLANPTSNHIYRSVGFRPVCDVDQWVFDA